MSRVSSLKAYAAAQYTPADLSYPESASTLLLKQAEEIFRSQADVISSLEHRIGESFESSLETILNCRGHVVVTGVGKSGLIGQKIAATFSSTGTASFFLHPTEALHGELGRVAPSDVVILISNSGKTEEVMRLVPHFRALGLPMIGLLGNSHSELWEVVDHALDVSVSREACPHNLAPTTSILATLAMADALAVSLMRARDFRTEDFSRSHPGGSLGRRLGGAVCSVMRTTRLPLIAPDQKLSEALQIMSEGGLGLGIVTASQTGDELPTTLGLVTDGDIRRAVQDDASALEKPVSHFMSRAPVTIAPDGGLEEARNRMKHLRFKTLLVVDGSSRLHGVVDLFSI